MSDSSSIIDVAQKAGVSIATVSRVLNRSAAVAPETVETVMKWVRDLGYELPKRRRRGENAKSGTATARNQIAMVGINSPSMMWLDVPAIGRAVRSITRTARTQGYRLILEDIVDLAQLDSIAETEDLAGVIVWLANYNSPELLRRISRRLPVVRLMGDQFGAQTFDHVAPNNEQVGALAFDYLKSQGCESFLFVTFSPQYDISRVRAEGFFRAAESAGMASQSVLIKGEPQKNYARWPCKVCRDWAQAADAILATPGRPLGIFVSTDAQASSLQPLLHERGAKLGRELIIVSCDNDDTALSGLSPRPATVDLLSEEIGRVAFEQLLWRIRHPESPALRTLVTPVLIPPHSVAKPSVSGKDVDPSS